MEIWVGCNNCSKRELARWMEDGYIISLLLDRLESQYRFYPIGDSFVASQHCQDQKDGIDAYVTLRSFHSSAATWSSHALDFMSQPFSNAKEDVDPGVVGGTVQRL
jgi:hypothetical protein